MGGDLGPVPGMEPGISPTDSPSAPLSAQETELGLNIDFLLHKGVWVEVAAGLGPCGFVSLQCKTEIAGTLASSAPSHWRRREAARRGKLRSRLPCPCAGPGHLDLVRFRCW